MTQHVPVRNYSVLFWDASKEELRRDPILFFSVTDKGNLKAVTPLGALSSPGVGKAGLELEDGRVMWKGKTFPNSVELVRHLAEKEKK